jgi:hypothetical protein
MDNIIPRDAQIFDKDDANASIAHERKVSDFDERVEARFILILFFQEFTARQAGFEARRIPTAHVVR